MCTIAGIQVILNKFVCDDNKFVSNEGEGRISAEKIENGKGANAKTNLIGCNVDAAPKKSKYS